MLFDNVKINAVVHEYLHKKAWKRKYEVGMHRITSDTISQWKPIRLEPWETIDPYSSLEDIGNTSHSTSDDESSSHTDPPLHPATIESTA